MVVVGRVNMALAARSDSFVKSIIRLNSLRKNIEIVTLDHVVSDKLWDMIDAKCKFYRQITDSCDFAKSFLRGKQDENSK